MMQSGNIGEVIAAGPGRVHPETAILIETAVSIGDKVLYGKYDGTELKYDNEAHQLIKDDDVLLTYHGEEATIDNVECVKDQVAYMFSFSIKMFIDEV